MDLQFKMPKEVAQWLIGIKNNACQNLLLPALRLRL